VEKPLQQLTMLITADGRWVLPDSEEFLDALGDRNPDYDTTGFAVRNLGFIKFQVFDHLVTEIELHPRNVDLRALLALEGKLGDAGTNLFRIKYLEDEWHSEISASAEHTVARLRELCAPVFEPPPTERFHVEARDPSVLFSQARRTEGLGLMAMKWRVSFGNFDESVIALASRYDLLPLMAITHISEPEADPVFRFIGDGHRWAPRQYQLDQLAGGCGKVEDIPDKEYGHWVAEFHRLVAVSGQPRYDQVIAELRIAQEKGQPQRKLVYERLLLPWRASSGEVWITSCARKAGTERPVNLAPDAPDSSVAK
jgi:hypothetical protein